MKYIYKMETLLISTAVILSSVLLIKLLFILRSALPWRVNCWFCNSNFWIKYPDRNCWTCRKCDQYNGFTKDGDYNKQITTFTEQKSPKNQVFQRSPPKNGLCKMCNINQQLKVAQLANFVPMNEKNFDEEIEGYRLRLEKAYKLCSTCRKVVQMKLHKEKETLLGSKLIQARTPEKRNHRQVKHNNLLKKLVNNTSMLLAVILFVLVSFELYSNVAFKYKNLFSTIANMKQTMLGVLERMYSIAEMKTNMTFPSVKNYYFEVKQWMPKDYDNIFKVENLSVVVQKALGSFVCFLQIIGLVWNINSMKNTIIIDLQWIMFVVATLGSGYVAVNPIYLTIIKTLNTLVLILVYKSIKVDRLTQLRVPMTPKRMKNLTSMSSSLLNDQDDTTNLDTDDDVSLSKFGLHNISESSNDTFSPSNTNVLLNRSFTPRSDTLWTKPKLNSTFCVNSVLSKSPSSVSDTVFVKPSFHRYQKLAKEDSDSELDESISSLCIGSPKKSKKKSASIFSLRKFTATPSFVAPTPISRSRPLISPSKLGHGTSWVAGGYWGSEGDRQSYNINGSRSSSQSSGFESQTSSGNQRTVFSQPPSREESVCGEPMDLDRFPLNNFGSFQSVQSFGQLCSPVFPQMQYNNHVHIPQARSRPGFTTASQCAHDSFKSPRLIKLPQVNTFSSR